MNSRRKIMRHDKILKFPAGFLWGVSTSAYQTEGGIECDWSRWEKSEKRIKKLKAENKNPDDYICGQACDSYNRVEEDINLVEQLNCQACRFTVEWARVEPENGKISMPAIKHYQNLIKRLKNKGMEPFLTLNHYTLPVWISGIGGWENKKTIEHYLKFAETIIEAVGQDVKYWLTFNEPQIQIGYGYISGQFPPNVKNLWRARKALKNLMQAHKQAYNLIHKKLGAGAQASITHNLIYYTPYKNNFLNNLIVKLLKYICNRRIIEMAAGCQDFIGLQYYHHDRIKLKLGGRFLIADSENENKELTDMGWEIFPQGIYYLLMELKKYGKPIFITENGIADANDSRREKFIIEHLRYIHKAMAEGADVRGYFHWSLLDNFEWAHGWGPKFGLYSVDRASFKREPRPSAAVYAEICKNNEVKIV
ncbi:MAG: glycoside hydrolase family 1 protein [bacterium]